VASHYKRGNNRDEIDGDAVFTFFSEEGCLEWLHGRKRLDYH
jgi:hypothetical protein